MRGLRVYIAGKLSSKEKTDRDPSKIVTDYIQNVHAMCKVASDVRKRGHYPYVPGLDFLLGAIAGNWTEEDYRGIGKEFLAVCDAVLVVSYSYGVNEEINLARALGIPVYLRIEELPDAV